MAAKAGQGGTSNGAASMKGLDARRLSKIAAPGHLTLTSTLIRSLQLTLIPTLALRTLALTRTRTLTLLSA